MGKYYKHPDAQGKIWINNFVKIEELFEGYIIEFREKKWFVADMNQLVMDLQECLLDPNSVGEAIYPLTNEPPKHICGICGKENGTDGYATLCKECGDKRKWIEFPKNPKDGEIKQFIFRNNAWQSVCLPNPENFK